MECFKCGVSGDKVKLFDVISKEGIVKICEKCFLEESLPLVRKPTNFQLKEISQKPRQTVYERLSEMSGIKNEGIRRNELPNKQEAVLKKIVNQNFEAVSGEEQKKDLVDNFYWIIMRARRLKHLTQNQFADAIAESEAAIKAVEKGILPKNNYAFIKKIENYLGIKLMKKDVAEQKIELGKKISFDPLIVQTLTIADLQDMKKKKEEEIFKEFDSVPSENYEFNKNINLDDEEEKGFSKNRDEDLSDEEIKKLIWKK